MKQQSTITLVVIVAAVLVLGGIIAAEQFGPASTSSAAEEAQVVRADSHRLGAEAPDGSVTVTEFLDFECEACGAAYPLVEQLRERYEGRVTFVFRYFPNPGHANARNAAHAVEAAARQGRQDEMYAAMFETQTSWGESRDSKAALFRRFAEEIGLDLEQYDADVASDATSERVQRDLDEGLALGVQGTPTFFVDDQQVELRTADDLTAAIDAALAAGG